jgi:hypothetical protein
MVAPVAPALERAVEADEIVTSLRRYGLTQRDIAAATRVSERAVHGWKAQGGIRPDSYDQLAALRSTVLLLSDSLTPRGVGQWFHARVRVLDDQRPLDVLAGGGEDAVAQVRAAAQGLVDGAYV